MVLLTRTSVLAYLGEVTIAPITSTIRDIPSEVRLGPEDGLSRVCAVNCDHLQTVSKARLGRVVTRLSTQKLADIKRAISFAIDLS